MSRPPHISTDPDPFWDDEADMDLIDYRKRRSRRSDPGMDPEDDLVVDELGRREYAEDRTAQSLPTPASAMTRRRLQLASSASGAVPASNVTRAGSCKSSVRRSAGAPSMPPAELGRRRPCSTAPSTSIRSGEASPATCTFATEANDLEDVLGNPGPLASPEPVQAVCDGSAKGSTRALPLQARGQTPPVPCFGILVKHPPR